MVSTFDGEIDLILLRPKRLRYSILVAEGSEVFINSFVNDPGNLSSRPNSFFYQKRSHAICQRYCRGDLIKIQRHSIALLATVKTVL